LIAHAALIKNFKAGESALDEEDVFGPGRRNLLVVGDILKIEAEILGREGRRRFSFVS
jgi:hypothetical protein